MTQAAGRPVVGLTAYSVRAAWGVWDMEAVLVPRSYVDAVARAGGLPVVLPPLPGVVEAVLPRLDALLLAGGQDVEPWRYGQQPDPQAQQAAPQRDAAELALLAGALDADLPVLGICRGMQVLNIARGGSLHQHLPDLVGHDEHAPAPGVYGDHPVRVEPGTLLAKALGGRTETSVPAYHHQGVDRLGDRLVASAWSGDGLVEAVEDPTLPFCVGVQWHPEAGADPALFEALVAAARDRLAARGWAP
jgi:putative glutamine amidotransferase